MRRLSQTAIGGALLVLLLTGCATSSGHAARTMPTTSPSAPTATYTCPECVSPLTLAQAWGHPTIHILPTAMDSGRKHVFVFDNTATPDGQWLVGTIEPRDLINNTTELSYAVLYNVTTRQIITMHALLHPQSQIIAASADATWVVWSEGDDQPNFSDWTLFAYNRQTRQVARLAQAVQVGGKPVAGGYPVPVVDAGHVIWGQPVGPVGPGTWDNAVVRMEDLATGQVATLAKRAGIPALSWPWALWGQFTSTGSMDGGKIILTNLSTGQTEQLAQQSGIIALDGTSLAWDDLNNVYLMDNFTKGAHAYIVIAFSSNPGDYLEDMTLSARIVAWTSQYETQVYDRAERRLVTLPVSPGQGAIWTGGRVLLWMNPEPRDQQAQDDQAHLIPTPALVVIDTSTLPVEAGAGQ